MEDGRATANQYISIQGTPRSHLLSLGAARDCQLPDSCFETIAMLEGELKATFTGAAMLRQSILKKAFAGRLVPQDPTDEPASALLARIWSDISPGTALFLGIGQDGGLPSAEDRLSAKKCQLSNYHGRGRRNEVLHCDMYFRAFGPGVRYA